MAASVLLYSGPVERCWEDVRETDVGLGLEVLSMPWSRLLSSAAINVFEEALFEGIGSAIGILTRTLVELGSYP